MRRRGLLLSLALTACADSRVEFDLSAVAFDHAQVVVLDPSGAVVGRSDPVARDARGDLTSIPLVRLPATGGTAWLVALDAAMLSRLAPGFLEGVADAAAVVGASDAAVVDGRVVVPLPPATRVHRLPLGAGGPVLPASTAGAEGLVPQLRLSLAVRPPECAPLEFTDFVPWHAAGLAPLGRGVRPDRLNFREVVRIDEDRLLVADAETVTVLARDRLPAAGPPGGTLERLPLELLEGARPPDDRDRLRVMGIALAPTSTRADGLREVLVALSRSRGRARAGRLVRLWLGPTGLRRDPGPPLAELEGVGLGGAAIDAHGRAVAVGRPGVVILRPAVEAAFRGPQVLGLSEIDDAEVALATGDPEHPLATATRERIHRWRAPADTWVTSLDPRGSLDPAFEIKGLDAFRGDAGDTEYWASGWGGYLATLGPGGMRREPLLRYPTAVLGACLGASLDEEGFYFSDSVEDLEVEGEYTLALVASCGGVSFLRRSDRCIHHVPVVPGSGKDDATPLADLVTRALPDGRREVLLLGKFGELWTATWRDR